MARKFLIGTGKFIKRIEFNAFMILVIGILGLIFPNIPQQNLNDFFQFNSAWELIKCVAIVVALIFGIILFFQIIGNLLISWGKNISSNIEIVEYIQKNSNPLYVSLEIVNFENSDLTECYGTLVEIEQFYSIETKINIHDEVNPNRRLLSWGAGSDTEYVKIPRNHGRKVLNIATMTENGGFIFWFHDWRSERKSVGKYHVVIEINGKIDDIPIRAIRYDGCFRSENYITPLVPVASYREGENGERIGERVTTYGGVPASKLDFVKCKEHDK